MKKFVIIALTAMFTSLALCQDEIYSKKVSDGGSLSILKEPTTSIATTGQKETILRTTYSIEKVSSDGNSREVMGKIDHDSAPGFKENVELPPYPDYFGVLDAKAGDDWVAVVYWDSGWIEAEVVQKEKEGLRPLVDIKEKILCPDFHGHATAQITGTPSTGLVVAVKTPGSDSTSYRRTQVDDHFRWKLVTGGKPTTRGK